MVLNSDLNRPKGFIIGPLPSGEQQTDNLLNVIARPKDEVHLLCAAYHILQIRREREQCKTPLHVISFTPSHPQAGQCSPYSPFALTGIGARVVAPHLFAGVRSNSPGSSWNSAHLVRCFLRSCWSSLAPLQLPQKVLTSSSSRREKNKLYKF